MDLITVTVRDILRKQKEIFSKVEATDSPIVVTQHNRPQVAIINLNDLKLLQTQKALKYTHNLLRLGDEAKKYNPSGPKDLSSNHDKYIWDK
ncbi:MAG: type II toxin-antitoxin system prevent-host-death family antitoxin [Patescibacteria group bacterium]